LLKEDNVPPLRWQLGCIQEVIPGGDGVIRVAMVRTATDKLAVMPIDSEIVGTLPLPTRGVCSQQIAHRCSTALQRSLLIFRRLSYTTKAVAYLFSNYFVSMHMPI